MNNLIDKINVLKYKCECDSEVMNFNSSRSNFWKGKLRAFEEVIELIGDLPRIELFARNKVEGWDCWGNEIPKEEQRGLKL